MRAVKWSKMVVDVMLLLPVFLVVMLKVLIQGAGIIVQRRTEHTQTFVDLLRNLLVYHTTRTFSASQLQLILPSTITVYHLHCRRIRATSRIDRIPTTANANETVPGCWLGDPSTAQVILVFCHGGGFVMPGVLPHFELLSRLIFWTSGKLAVLVPAYSLAPAATYPVQLGECVDALRYVFKALNRSPKEVIIGGDSAGGNLVLAILSHILHPHPQAEKIKPLDLQSHKLKGAFVIGPWISIDEGDLELRHGLAHMDIVEPRIAQEYMRLYKGNMRFDPYILAETATEDWWAEIDQVVEHILVTTGSEEILNWSITKWIDVLRQGAGEDVITSVIGQGEIHDEPVWPKGDEILDTLNPRKCQEAAIRDWIRRQV